MKGSGINVKEDGMGAAWLGRDDAGSSKAWGLDLIVEGFLTSWGSRTGKV